MISAVVSFCLVTFLLSYILVWQPASLPPEEDLIGVPSREDMLEKEHFQQIEATPYILYMNGHYHYAVDGVIVKVLSEEDLQLPEYADLEIIIANTNGGQ